MNAEMMTLEPIEPWVGMLTRPRETMRYLLEHDPQRQVHTLAMAGGMASELMSSMLLADGHFSGGAMLLGAIGGLLSLYVYGFLLTWCGRLLGGRGSGKEVRAALAWANVPALWATALLAVLFVAFNRMDAGLGLSLAVMVVVMVVGTVWATVAQIKAVAEAHDFSTGRSFLAHVLAGVVLAAIGLGLALALLSLMTPISPPPYELMSA